MKTKHFNHMMKRLQYSGYNQRFRYEVRMSALHAIEEMKRKDENGKKSLQTQTLDEEKKEKEQRDEKEKLVQKRSLRISNFCTMHTKFRVDEKTAREHQQIKSKDQIGTR